MNIPIDARSSVGIALAIAQEGGIVRETETEFGDESHFIYVDSSKDAEDTELGRLMKDFNSREAKDMRASVLAKRIRERGETEKGVEHMCKEMEEIREDGQLEKAKKLL